MQKLTILFLTLLLSSCASLHYGNFTQASSSRDIFLAQDAASQLTRVYPPAQNIFCIGQKLSDGFGMALIHKMREKGYGIMEHCPKQKANFFYVVDEIKQSSLYRVSLYIGSQTLSRVYVKTKEQLLPFSPWSHKD